MTKINTDELQAQLDAAHSRIAELEAQAATRPVTVRTMKAEISKLIGVQLSGGDYTYGCTVSREDLIKIHTWMIAQGAKS
jgi:hypothetical protein